MNRCIAAIICLAVGTSLVGAEVSPTAKPYTLVRVKLSAGESAGVLSRDFVPIEFAATEGGIVWTGPPGRYAVVVSGGTAGLQILPVEISGAVPPKPPVPPGPTPPDPTPPGPTPPVPPDPNDDICARLYPLIQATNDRPTAAKLAANYRTVLAAVESGEIKSVQVARTKLVGLHAGMILSQAWKPPIDAMVKELNGVLDITSLKRVFRGTIAALESAR